MVLGLTTLNSKSLHSIIATNKYIYHTFNEISLFRSWRPSPKSHLETMQRSTDDDKFIPNRYIGKRVPHLSLREHHERESMTIGKPEYQDSDVQVFPRNSCMNNTGMTVTSLDMVQLLWTLGLKRVSFVESFFLFLILEGQTQLLVFESMLPTGSLQMSFILLINSFHN